MATSTSYPHLDRLAERVRAAMGPNASAEAVKLHTYKLAGEPETFARVYLDALKPGSASPRQDAGEAVDAVRAASDRFRRATEDAWKKPTVGVTRGDGQMPSPEVASVAVSGAGATAPGGKLAVPPDAIPKAEGAHSAKPGSEPPDEEARTAARLKQFEDLWKLPIGVTRGDL